MKPYITFKSTRVEGETGVESVSIYQDRIELFGNAVSRTINFSEIAKWSKPEILSKLFSRLWFIPKPSVGERDWFHKPGDRYYKFYSSPEITIYVPEETDEGYAETNFGKINQLITKGGYSTFDLG